MPSTIRETIVAAAVTALGAVGKPTGLNIHRQRRRPIDTDGLPATVVYVIREDIKPLSFGSVRDVERTLRLRLEHRASHANTVPEDQALDTYVAWGTAALKADETLGGYARQINEVSIEWDGEQADKVYAAAAQDFEIIYETTEASQTTSAL